ncbi:MAG: M20 family metallopeptidase [Deltaproteobacteria bacterium]|nr:M20 family metallopeptidase [Deltaproteobacteria bacterium]
MPTPARPQPSEALKARAAARVDAEREALLALSGRIHANPELCFDEHRAAGWLTEYLESRGLKVERGAYAVPTAFAARAGSGRPRIAVLCEYDALPGIGHACGHNIIAAAGAGAGVALAEVIAETGGSVVVLGTPAEEGGGGKVLMAREGAFAEVDAAMMIHPASLELIGMNVLSITAVEAEYRGRAAHAAAAPFAGINALDGLVTAYQAIAQLRQHIRPSERVHGIITDGGQKPNIVPERAAGLFYIRAANDKRLAKLRQRVEGCFHAGAQASGATVHLRQVGEDYSDMWTNAPLAAAYQANLASVGRHVVEAPSELVSGSTDMGNVSKLVPSIHPMIGIAPAHVALHTADFATYAGSPSGQQGVIDGAKVLAMTAIDLLCSAELLDAARVAFQAEQGA